jgi:hypothetical protein
VSFETLKKNELLATAEYFGADVKATQNKNEIISELEDIGVTFEQYSEWKSRQAAVEDDEDAPVVTEQPEIATRVKESVGGRVLVKMTRANPTYETFGYRFTKDNPYVAMSEEDAQNILDFEEGFVIASPREVQEFYS